MPRHLRPLLLATLLALGSAPAPRAQARPQPPSFEIVTRRMDVDVDGAPNAYGPPGSKALDNLLDAHYHRRRNAKIVGYLTQPHHPDTPLVQGPHDPFPGYYISQTAFEDPHCANDNHPRCYLDAARINYVVLGNAARRRGVRLGDFAAVYSRRTHRSAFAIVGDDGNPSGDEGSLHLLQALGYPFHNGIDDAVEDPEIVIRSYPHSNPTHRFFHTQSEINAAALQLGLSREFAGKKRSKE